MNREQLLFHLNRLGACTEAVGWVRGSVMTPAALWCACRRGDWMLWLAAKAEVNWSADASHASYAVYDARSQSLKVSSRMVRKHITWRAVRAALEANNG